MTTASDNLVTAQKALTALLTGTAVVQVRDSDGSFVAYSRANLGDLRAYIDELKAEVAAETGVCRPSGPMRIFFT